MPDPSHSLAPPSDEPSVGDVILDKYRLEALLGEGGMGRVFVGENLLTGKLVALKCLLSGRSGSEEQLLRFRVEARAAGRIEHPNVIQVYDVLEDDGRTYLVMEKLNGEALSDLLDRERRLPVADAIGIALEAMRGLAAAHKAGVIHRDIKPANIFLCAGSAGARVKVLDFGVSKLVDLTGMDITRTGAFVGTPHYMAPEQVRGLLDLDHRIDVYSLGAMLYEMLAGAPPFVAANFTSLLVEIATGTYLPVSVVRGDTGPELDAVLARALARNRDERYPDIDSFARALEPFGDGTEFRPSGPEWTGRVRQTTPSQSKRGPKSSVRASSRETHASDDLRVDSRAETRRTPGAAQAPSSGAQPANAEPVTEGGQSKGRVLVALLLAATIGVWAWTAGTSSPSAETETLGEPPGEPTALEQTAEVPAPATPELAPVADVEPVVEIAEEPEAELAPDAAVSETSMQRRTRPRRRGHALPPEMSGMASHRAGELTLEDF